MLEHWQLISSCKEEWFIQVLRGWEPRTGSEADDQHKQAVNSGGNSASQRKRGRKWKTYGQSQRSRSKFEQWKQIQKFRQGNICSCLSTYSKSCWGDCVGHGSQSLKWKLSSDTSELMESANPQEGPWLELWRSPITSSVALTLSDKHLLQAALQQLHCLVMADTAQPLHTDFKMGTEGFDSRAWPTLRHKGGCKAM